MVAAGGLEEIRSYQVTMVLERDASMHGPGDDHLRLRRQPAARDRAHDPGGVRHRRPRTCGSTRSATSRCPAPAGRRPTSRSARAPVTTLRVGEPRPDRHRRPDLRDQVRRRRRDQHLRRSPGAVLERDRRRVVGAHRDGVGHRRGSRRGPAGGRASRAPRAAPSSASPRSRPAGGASFGATDLPAGLGDDRGHRLPRRDVPERGPDPARAPDPGPGLLPHPAHRGRLAGRPRPAGRGCRLGRGPAWPRRAVPRADPGPGARHRPAGAHRAGAAGCAAPPVAVQFTPPEGLRPGPAGHPAGRAGQRRST